MLYQHRQFNLITLGLLFLGVLMNLVLFLDPDSWLREYDFLQRLYQISTAHWQIYAMVISSFVVLLVVNFSILNIQFSRQNLRWSFGIGVPYKQIKMADIKSVEVVRNKWWYGFGIRKLRHGWLYNVSGLDAVELKLNNGKVIRLGTSDVKNLSKRLTKVVTTIQSKEVS